MTRGYADYPELATVYLEDSYALSISQLPSEVRFCPDAVLAPQHPAYSEALPGEQYCYARGDLVVTGVTKVDWIERSLGVHTDAAGEQDYGNIDSLTHETGVYAVEGDWGQVRIHSNDDPLFVLTNDLGLSRD